MGDLIGVDFKSKKRLGLIETPLQEGLSIIAQAMADGSGIDGLAWPGMDVQAPHMSNDKDPA